MVSEDRGETMQEYLAVLLIFSLVLWAFFFMARKIIPLNALVICGTVGISFALGAFFPMAAANLTWGKVLSLYGVIIAIAATVLGYLGSRVPPVQTTPVAVADLTTENDTASDTIRMTPAGPDTISPDELPVPDGLPANGQPATDREPEAGWPVAENVQPGAWPVTEEAPATDWPVTTDTSQDAQPATDGETKADWPVAEDGIGIDEQPVSDKEPEAGWPVIGDLPADVRPASEEKAAAMQVAATIKQPSDDHMPFPAEALSALPDTCTDAVSDIEFPPAGPVDLFAPDEMLPSDGPPLTGEAAAAQPVTADAPGAARPVAADGDLAASGPAPAVNAAVEKPATTDDEPAIDWRYPATSLWLDELAETNGAQAVSTTAAAEPAVTAGELETGRPATDALPADVRPASEENTAAMQAAATIEQPPDAPVPVSAGKQPTLPHTYTEAMPGPALLTTGPVEFTVPDAIGTDELPVPDSQPAGDQPATDTEAAPARPVAADARPAPGAAPEAGWPAGAKYPAEDFIAEGFRAKDRGDLNAALHYFFKAFQSYQKQQVSIVLAMEISAIYQEQGQYLQAGMILHSVLAQANSIQDLNLKQILKRRLIYLDTLVEVLKVTKMSGLPHSQIPDYIKREASIKSLQEQLIN